MENGDSVYILRRQLVGDSVAKRGSLMNKMRSLYG